ncbi:MAG: glycosyltransferase [Verrucomicrobiales bacterium]
MKITMFTNTYLPHVGGVARSVKTLEDACRRRGHQVRVIAPEFDGAEDSPDVLRVPAIQHFNGSDFCVRLPFSHLIRDSRESFRSDLIHSHHPFLLGDTALRESWKLEVPIVFTHHTLYERYTHYVPLDSPPLKRAVIHLATDYCNLCDQVIAPSASIAELLRKRGVETDIEVIPTGIDAEAFGAGVGDRFRDRKGIPRDARVIGHVGRLAEEKNLLFLAEAVAGVLGSEPDTVFLLVGEGNARDKVLEILRQRAEPRQICLDGRLTGSDLADAYAAMDCFAFASQSETQGLVLAEAMAAGTPVVALDGPGVREIVKNGENGIMLPGDATALEFAEVLRRLMGDPARRREWAVAAQTTAESFSADRCTERMLACYERLVARKRHPLEVDAQPWEMLLRGLEIEWDLISAKAGAAAAAMGETPAEDSRLD